LGTVQGGSISPLLANIYLHYAFDLWVNQWRGRHARGDVIVVRYAGDWVAGFQFRDDAERFKRAVQERLGQFGLKLHPDKTRLIEFGRFARENRRRRGLGKPDTFDFLGFTHCCGKTRKGKFMVLRITSGKRLRAKLLAVKKSCAGACTSPSSSRASTCARWWPDTPATSPCPATGRVCRPFASRSAGCGIARCAAAFRPNTSAGSACTRSSLTGCLPHACVTRTRISV
jgi:hypothetical protein